VAKKKAKPINFAVEIGAAEKWENLQRRVAARVVAAYMIAAPRLGRHRRAIVRKLFDGDHNHIKSEEVSSTTSQLALTIREKVRRSSSLMRNYTSPKAQRARLHFDPALRTLPKKERGTKKLYGAEIRSVVITGMMVLTFDWADRLGHPLFLQDVKRFLLKEGGVAFWGSDVSFYKSGIDDAWKTKRDVAHLCAALVVFMTSQHKLSSEKGPASRRFTEDEDQKLITEIEHYLGCAKWFEGVMAKVAKRAHATMKIELRPLPDAINVKTVAYGGILSIPDRFAKAFEIWRTSTGA
jgi:hypothetical protein